MKDYKLLKISVEGHIAIVRISRPEALNALNSELFTEMKSCLLKLDANPEIRGLVITGDGKAFVAGADISEMVNMTTGEAENFSAAGQDVFNLIGMLRIPVIAAVNGFALGGGCELAMACDIRIASNKAKFGQPEVNIGLIPGFAGSQRMPRIIGLGNALLYLMTGDQITSTEALRIGLVQKVVESERLMDESLDLINKIVSRGPSAVAKVKKVIRQGLEVGFTEGSILESTEFGSLFGNEGTEGMKAFLEKREPNWN